MKNLQRPGIYTTLASIAVTAYIGLRFRSSFAIGGIAATLHDMLVTLGCRALAGYDLSLNVTAALLTITGYSVNDTIVVFDRVRETWRVARRDPLRRVVNLSVNQTLSRTIMTAGTTFLAAFALFLFGGEALEGFAFTMLIGIVGGTYSTVFIASGIAIILSKQKGQARVAAMNARGRATATLEVLGVYLAGILVAGLLWHPRKAVARRRALSEQGRAPRAHRRVHRALERRRDSLHLDETRRFDHPLAEANA